MNVKKFKEEKVNEILGILFLLAGLFALISLLFFHPNDHAFYTSHPNQPFRNVTGISGVFLAHYLRLSFGFSAYSIPSLFLFWSGCFFLQKVPQRKLIELIAMLISILAISGLFTLVAPASWKIHAGGLLGYLIAGSLEKYFGVIGGLIISSCFLALSLIIATDFLLYPLFERFVVKLKHWTDGIRTLLFHPNWFRGEKTIPREDPRAVIGTFGLPKVKKYGAVQGRESVIEKPETGEPPFVGPVITGVKIKKPGAIKTKSFEEEASKREKEILMEPRGGGELPADYRFPSLDLLKVAPAQRLAVEDDLQQNSRILEDTLRDFGIEAKVVEIEQGPVITRYELLPAPGVKVNRIVSLSDDLALVLKAASIRFITPIPGKSAMGIEIPNSTTTIVMLRELLESEEFQKHSCQLALLLGKDTSGKPIVADLAEMPHLLIAGATGSGKTVCVNSIIAGLLFSKSPEELKFVMVDPKMVELATYKQIPHMLTPVVTDVRKAASTLNWLVTEMERRYQIFAACGTRNIQAFNQRKKAPNGPEMEKGGEIPKSLPYILLVIDELADLMAVAQDKVENAITRLAQLSRAVGIHLILATQRPSVDVITGVIKANFPARISFKVATKVDSRTVLDMNGADKLLGKGDMLFMKPGDPKPTRGQSTFISDEEINALVSFIQEQQRPQNLLEIEAASGGKSSIRNMEKDEMYEEAVRVVLETRQASVSVLQRKLRLGYGRAARMIDTMEEEGIVGPYQGSRAREILVDRVQEVGESS